MSNCKLSIFGIEGYLSKEGDSLFKDIKLPEGLDKDLLVDNILLKSEPFSATYTDPEILKIAINTHFRLYYPTFKKWHDASIMDYNPIENYDRKEDWLDAGNDRAMITGSDVQDNDVQSISNDMVVTYEVNGLRDSGANDTKTISKANTTNKTQRDFNFESGKSGRAHGNIGVTTTQQMLEQEYKIATYNVIEKITDVFIANFCIMVY